MKAFRFELSHMRDFFTALRIKHLFFLWSAGKGSQKTTCLVVLMSGPGGPGPVPYSGNC